MTAGKTSFGWFDWLARAFARSATFPRFALATIASLFIRFGVMESAASETSLTQKAMPLDLRFAYTPTDVRELFGELGPSGLDAYAHFLMSYDVIYPISYLLMIGWAIALLLRKRPSRLILVAPGIFVFDMFENLTIVAMAWLQPEFWDGLAIAASAFTSIKWILVVFALGTLLWLSVTRLLELRKPNN